MKSIETTYLGLKLKNPVIVSSSGLTNTVEKIKKIEANGAAAVVLKSLFEEQINFESTDLMQYSDYPEASDYIQEYIKTNSVDKYLDLIRGAKAAVGIPVIASINCVTALEWLEFAQKIAAAGADAIELNINIVPTSCYTTNEQIEERYFEIVRAVCVRTQIPVAVKIGSHFTNILGFADKLVAAGAKGVVLFNRFYEPDIDIKNLKFTSAEIFSSKGNIRQSLRWIGLLSGQLKGADLSASTGVHDSEGAIKQLLAGATTVQVCSTLYKNGVEQLGEIIQGLNEWMTGFGYKKIADFRGKLSYTTLPNHNVYERSQFMRYFSSVE